MLVDVIDHVVDGVVYFLAGVGVLCDLKRGPVRYQKCLVVIVPSSKPVTGRPSPPRSTATPDLLSRRLFGRRPCKQRQVMEVCLGVRYAIIRRCLLEAADSFGGFGFHKRRNPFPHPAPAICSQSKKSNASLGRDFVVSLRD